MLKKVIIIMCLLALVWAGGAYADDKGEKMPGGKFSTGEYSRTGYQNAWMGLSFSPQNEYVSKTLGDNQLAFYKYDAGSVKRLESQDFAKVWAFSYILKGFDGTLQLYVLNLTKEQTNLGIVKDRDDYLEKLTAYLKEDKKVLNPKFSEVYDALLGGRDFKAFDVAFLDSDMQKRYYVQQIDGFLVVVEMTAAVNAERNVKLLEEYVACFTKYNGE